MEKKLTRKIGELKRKFKLGKADIEPGTFINAAKSQETKKELPKNKTLRTEILGGI